MVGIQRKYDPRYQFSLNRPCLLDSQHGYLYNGANKLTRTIVWSSVSKTLLLSHTYSLLSLFLLSLGQFLLCDNIRYTILSLFRPKQRERASSLFLYPNTRTSYLAIMSRTNPFPLSLATPSDSGYGAGSKHPSLVNPVTFHYVHQSILLERFNMH